VSGECDVGDGALADAHAEQHLVAAQRVVAFDDDVGRLDPAEVARTTPVVEDDLAGELVFDPISDCHGQDCTQGGLPPLGSHC
jgi:hypothetical protein